MVWWYFKVKSKISIKNEKVFFAEKRVLREFFKVALKEIGKEKFFWNFFHRFWFLYLDTFWYNDRYWKPSPGSTLHDSNGNLVILDDLSSFLFKKWAGSPFAFQRKKSNFFSKIENRPLHGSDQCIVIMNRSTPLKDVSELLSCYSIFKGFPFIFWLQNENYAWFLNKNSMKIFFQVLDITYHDKLLEICFGA